MVKTSNTAKLAVALALILQCGVAAWVLTDVGSGKYLSGEDTSERLPMGSTDKFMVALVALERVEAGELDLEEEVTVSPEAAGDLDPLRQRRRLRPGRALVALKGDEEASLWERVWYTVGGIFT